ncbi:MAG: sulfatase [Cyclobacteriaceae bacterium]
MRILLNPILLALIFFIYSCGEKAKQESTTKVAKSDKPNIVVIVSDDHGSRDAGCYGNAAIKTPNIDYLASEGVRFTNAYATSPSCSASRSVIMTGLYNHGTGHYGHMHSYHHFSTYDYIKSLPVYLEEYGGYRTGRVGKYHLAPESVYRFQKVFNASGRNPVAMADSIQAFVEREDGKPFFLYYCTNDPHRGGGDVEDNPYKPNAFGNKKNGYEGVEQFRISPEEVIVPSYLPDLPETRAELVEYYESVHRMDQGVGRVIKHLKESSNWENTIVVYISDNGIAFPGAKTNLYQPGTRLPCIVKNVKGIEKGTVKEQSITWADLTPTLLDLAGVLTQASGYISNLFEEKGNGGRNNLYPQDFHGTSFAEVLNGKPIVDNEAFLSHTFHEITMYYPMKSYISGDYKLIWNVAYQLPYPHASDLWSSATWQAALKTEEQKYGKRSIEAYSQRAQFELYNLKEDPHEVINLANDKNSWEVLEGMKTKMKAIQEETFDPWRSKWVYE